VGAELACRVRQPAGPLMRPLALPTDTRHQKGRGFASRIEGTWLTVDTCRTAKKPKPPKPISWNV
jgi:hypothetical protein